MTKTVPTRLATALTPALALVLAMLLSPVVHAGPPADKGQGAAHSSQGKGNKGGADETYDDRNGEKGKGNQKDSQKSHDDDRYGDDRDDGNHGQRVSECNHRANERSLKGQDRKEFVEWCVDRGDRYQYDDRRFTQDRSCYRRADEKGLSGDFRRVFISDCLQRQEKKR